MHTLNYIFNAYSCFSSNNSKSYKLRIKNVLDERPGLEGGAVRNTAPEGRGAREESQQADDQCRPEADAH